MSREDVNAAQTGGDAAHDLTQVGRFAHLGTGVLEDEHKRFGRGFQRAHPLLPHFGVLLDVWGGGINGGGDGIAAHRSQLGQQAADVHAHEAFHARAHFKPFNGVADGRRIDLGDFVELLEGSA
jgi:hypothetical protein